MCKCKEKKFKKYVKKIKDLTKLLNGRGQFVAFPNTYILNIGENNYAFTDINDNTDGKGVYIFLATSEIKFKVEDAFYKFVVIDYKNEKRFICVPYINYIESEKEDLFVKDIIIEENQLIYAGETKELKKRISQHLDSNLNKTDSMKLGLREEIFGDKYKIMFCEINDDIERGEVEKYIHENILTRFGK